MAQAIERGSSSLDTRGLIGSQERAFIPEEFKGLRKFQKEQNIEIVRGSGPGFAEVFFEGERDSPNPEKNIVQVRDTGEFKAGEVAAADTLHFMGGENRKTNKPFNKEFFDLKQKFIKDLSPDAMQAARDQFQDAQDRGATGSNFESFDNFMQNVFGDMMIRGGLFPQLMTDPGDKKAFKERRPFTKDQSKILDKMNKIIRGR